jgi:hypothetical protein
VGNSKEVLAKYPLSPRERVGVRGSIKSNPLILRTLTLALGNCSLRYYTYCIHAVVSLKVEVI